MDSHRNNRDVSNKIDVTDTAAVSAEVSRIFLELYPRQPIAEIERAFRDLDALYRGKFPGFHGCDTPYHNVQHVLDVTLAMARLMDGYERAEAGAQRLEAAHFRLGVVTALFHDCGYVRELSDTQHRNGAELTLTHVSRGARFLKSYLPTIGMADMAETASALIHFTGYEIPAEKIAVTSLREKLLGTLLGSADIIAQMSDRCYLEKCRDRLYPEFLVGGIARKRLADGSEDVLCESGEDLVMKTPRFYESAARRLKDDLGGSHQYVAHHFNGQDPYLDEISKNVQFAAAINGEDDTLTLKRVPPRD
jgi:hypothetical protein